MKFLRFSILAFLLTSTVAVRADVTSDAAALSRWFSEELANATAFNAAASPQLPGDVHSLLGVELGVYLAVSSSKLVSSNSTTPTAPRNPKWPIRCSVWKSADD